MVQIDLNATKDESENEFQKRCEDMVMNSFVTLSMALGHKLRIFDHIDQHPKTSKEIAASADMKERYIREWLNVMVVGKIVEVDHTGTKFWIPAHRRRTLGADSSTLLYSTNLPVLASVYEQLSKCFVKNGPRGIPYAAYDGFFEYMTEVSDQVHEKFLLNKFVPSVPNLTEQLENGIVCLDVGCGRGTPSFLLAQKYPNSQFYGVDFSEQAIKFAVGRARDHGMTNLHYEIVDCAQMPESWTNKFDYVTAFDSIHDQAYPDSVLAEIQKVLKPGGTFSLVDIDSHSNVYDNRSMNGAKYMYTASLFHCMPVSLYFENGMGLGAMWGREKAEQMLEKARFKDIVFTKPEYNSYFNYHCLCQKCCS